jgi:hypothetical protein
MKNRLIRGNLFFRIALLVRNFITIKQSKKKNRTIGKLS